MAKKILIIDDDRDILEMLNIVFRDYEFDVILSDIGMTADEIKMVKPDIILLDVQIKGYRTTGDEICKEIKSRQDLNYIPILLISGEDNLNDLANGCYADGYLSKPFELASLVSMVRGQLD